MREVAGGKRVHPAALRDALLLAGLPVAAVHGDGLVVLALDEGDDTIALDAAEAEALAADEADRSALRDLLGVLAADIARLEDTAQALTAQAIRNHLARTDRALVAIMRHLRRRGL